MLALPHIASGKVREIYEIDPDHLLFVATDRISAYDVVLGDEIPDKGRVLTGLSLHFFDFLEVSNHFVTTDLGGVSELDDDQRAALGGRAMVVRRAEVVPVECVVRGYLYGSSWNEYRQGGGRDDRTPPGGPRSRRPPSRAAVHACHEGHERPRREHHREGDPSAARR